MSKISHYEKLIQEKRKETPFRDFIREIASWETLSFYKTKDGAISRYPETSRIKALGSDFWESAPNHMMEYHNNTKFSSQFRSLQNRIPLSQILTF